MNHYNVTFVLQGYKHSLSLVANEENHAKIVFKNIMVRRNIDITLCDIVVLELSNNR
jgi:1,2-phenylacetyl-CoA epoxidase PaaB subunit